MVSIFKRKKSGTPPRRSPAPVTPNEDQLTLKKVNSPGAATTPPPTPDPSSPPQSNIQVKILTEPKEIFSDDNSLEEDTFFSDSYYTAGSESYTAYTSGSDDRRRKSNESEKEVTFLDTMIAGMGCGPSFPFGTRAGGALSTIPEENILPPSWGMAPSEDSESETDTDTSIMERSVHYENFEMVLNPDLLPEKHVDDAKLLEEALGLVSKVKQRRQVGTGQSDLFCQPCEPLDDIEKTRSFRNTRPLKPAADDASNRLVIVEANSFESSEDSTFGKMVLERIRSKKVEDKENVSSSDIKSEDEGSDNAVPGDTYRNAADQRKEEAIARGKLSTRSVSNDEATELKDSTNGAVTNQPNESTPSKKVVASPSRKKATLRLLISLQKKLHKGRKREKDKSRRTSNHQSKSQSQEVSKEKKGKWKAVTDQTTGRLYYYHTRTKETSWKRPAAFIEWRTATDKRSGKHYFYNTITKETTWSKPEDFEEWRELKDEVSGKIYYYNVFSRKTSWSKQETFDSTDKKDREQKQSLAQDTSRLTSEEKEQISNEEVTDKGSDAIFTLEPPTSQAKKNEEEEKQSDEEPPAGITSQGDSEFSGPPVGKSLNQEKLSNLLFTHCPDEKENNEKLLRKCYGRETPVIKAIETLVEDTPFDELRLVVFSFVNTTLASLEDGSKDSNVEVSPSSPSKHNNGPPITCPSSLKRVPTGYSAALSLNSRMTNKTNRTEITNRINNTTRNLTGNQKQGTSSSGGYDGESLGLGHSFDVEESLLRDDMEEQKVILDMEAMEVVESKEKKSEQTEEDNEEDNKIAPPPPLQRQGSVKDCPTDKLTSRIRSDKKKGRRKGVGISMISIADSEIESAYAGDNDETDAGTWDDDNISALSDSFGPYHRRSQKEKKSMNKLRKKSSRVKSTNSDESSSIQGNTVGSSIHEASFHGGYAYRNDVYKQQLIKNSGRTKEWTQTELDMLISQSDWNSVSDYIAKMRKEEHEVQSSSGKDSNSESVKYEELPWTGLGRKPPTPPKKHFGARSQLQYDEMYEPDYAPSDSSSWDDDTMTTKSSVLGVDNLELDELEVALPSQSRLRRKKRSPRSKYGQKYQV